MRFLLDTNICSSYLKGEQAVWNRFVQHSGGLATSVVCAGELWTWVKRGKASTKSQRAVADFYTLIEIIDVDLEIALSFGELRATMMNEGTRMPDMDCLIAATAIVHDLTLVTHNTSDFANVKLLRLQDWLAP